MSLNKKVFEDDADTGLCIECNKNRGSELHSCPFAVEINDDDETLCNCCDECTQECRWYI